MANIEFPTSTRSIPRILKNSSFGNGTNFDRFDSYHRKVSSKGTNVVCWPRTILEEQPTIPTVSYNYKNTAEQLCPSSTASSYEQCRERQ